MSNPQGFPNINVPLVGADDRITTAWYLFLQSLWIRTGGALGQVGLSVDDGTLLATIESITASQATIKPANDVFPAIQVATAEAAADVFPAISIALNRSDNALPAIPIRRSSAPLPQQPAVGASPFIYRAPFNGVAYIIGGTVSGVAFSRDGSTYLNVGSGPVQMLAGDALKLTYSAAPTLTFIGN